MPRGKERVKREWMERGEVGGGGGIIELQIEEVRTM